MLNYELTNETDFFEITDAHDPIYYRDLVKENKELKKQVYAYKPEPMTIQNMMRDKPEFKPIQGNESKEEINKKLKVRQSSVSDFILDATRSTMLMEARLEHKKKNFIESVPVLSAINKKWNKFNNKMEEKYGSMYTKARNVTLGIGRLAVAAQFGAPGLVGLCVYNFHKNIRPVFVEAEKARHSRKCENIGEFMKHNRKQTALSFSKAVLGAAATTCGLEGEYIGREVARTLTASIVAYPELKATVKEFGNFLIGRTSFKEVSKKASVFGMTVAAYAAGSGIWNSTEAAETGELCGHSDGSVPLSKADKEKAKANDKRLSFEDLKCEYDRKKEQIKRNIRMRALGLRSDGTRI
ncbi:MAG: hypothetical protein MJ247_02675 [Alphaproteobacteria bacterium]|nr:hypothetical protein [Alphaproteobacteria bacterium]